MFEASLGVGELWQFRKLFWRLPDALVFNIVFDERAVDHPWPGNHMRILNLTPSAIRAVHLAVQPTPKNKDVNSVPLDHLYYVSARASPFGSNAIYRIPLKEQRAFIYPNAFYFYRLSNEINWENDVFVRVIYEQADRKKEKEIICGTNRSYIVRPDAVDSG